MSNLAFDFNITSLIMLKARNRNSTRNREHHKYMVCRNICSLRKVMLEVVGVGYLLTEIINNNFYKHLLCVWQQINMTLVHQYFKNLFDTSCTVLSLIFSSLLIFRKDRSYNFFITINFPISLPFLKCIKLLSK